MLCEDPEAELAPDFGFADPLDDLYASIAQDQRSRAVHPRVWVVHADHDARDAALGDRFRASGCASVERTWLESGVEGRADDAGPLGVSGARCGAFRVAVAAAQPMDPAHAVS